MNERSAEVVVVGGGLAGLTAAACVARAGHAVTVFEGRNRLGGRALTDRKDGYWLNQGPHALYRGGPGEAVLIELGIPRRGGQPPTRGRVAFDGRLRLAPAGPASLVRSRVLSTREKLEIARLLAALPKLDPAGLATQTVEEWVDRSVRGARSAQLLHALVRLATYVNDPARLSAEVAATQLRAALGSGVIYLDHGWQTMIDHLAAVPGVRIERGRTVVDVPDARVVILASGGPRAAGALLGCEFAAGPPATASCLDLGTRRRPPNDFVLGGDVPFYLSNHSAVADLAPEGRFHVAAAHYLGPDDDPDEAALRAFVGLSGIDDEDIVMRRHLHRMTTVSAFATAADGGLAGRPAVTDSGFPNVFLAGDWIGPVGHLADATLASAQAADAGSDRQVGPVRDGAMSADVAAFQAERQRLRALAYRMLGAAAEADDVVQDAWLRYSLAPGPIDRPEAWLTTVVTRLAVDRLRSARVRRETYVGPWLPEPIAEDGPTSSPEKAVIMAESLSIGFLAVLERLSPLERAVFLLHEVFDVPFAEVAEMIERSEAATRQLAKRARDHVHEGRPRFTADPDDVEALTDAFVAAAMSGDIDLLGSMLTDDVVHLSDGGADHRAARAPVVGRDRVARFFANLAQRTPEGGELHKVHANGQFAYYLTVHGEPYLLLVANWIDGRMAESFAVRNPDKLGSFHRAFLTAS